MIKKGEMVAVTGATGFIGEVLVKRLVENGYHVRILTRGNISADSLPQNVSVFTGDLTDPGSDISGLLNGVTALFHCAGEINSQQRMRLLHVKGTQRLVDCANGQVKHWIQLSSIGVYGHFLKGVVDENSSLTPTNLYEETKAESDQLVIRGAGIGGFDYRILRPSNVIGRGMPGTGLSKIVSAIKRGLFFFVGNGQATTNYLHVDNVVEALLLLAENDIAANRIYNLSDTQPLRATARTIASLLGVTLRGWTVPEGLLRWVVGLLERFGKFPLRQEGIDALVTEVVYPTNKIERELGYRHVRTGVEAYTDIVEVDSS